MHNAKPNIAVLMSTYNGEKFIREQLESIFSQKGVNVMLYVRDDGSRDDTCRILKEYANRFPLALITDGENLGPGASFLRLLYHYAFEPNIDYFAFADQDDIWLENKLQVAVNAIKSSNTTGPILYSSNQFLYVDGKKTGKRHKERQSATLISHLTRNTISGCTFVLNKELVQMVTKAKHAEPRVIKYHLHDAWLMLVAIACGHVIYDEEAYMLYRIHGGNVVGVKGITLKQRLGRLQRFFVNRDDANLRMITAQQLLKSFSDEMQEHDKTILKLYANYQNSWKEKWALLINPEVLRDCGENPLMFRLKVLVNFV